MSGHGKCDYRVLSVISMLQIHAIMMTAELNLCLGQSDTKDTALERVVNVMRSDITYIWTSTEVFKPYKEGSGVFLSRCALVQNCLKRS